MAIDIHTLYTCENSIWMLLECAIPYDINSAHASFLKAFYSTIFVTLFCLYTVNCLNHSSLLECVQFLLLTIMHFNNNMKLAYDECRCTKMCFS